MTQSITVACDKYRDTSIKCDEKNQEVSVAS